MTHRSKFLPFLLVLISLGFTGFPAESEEIANPFQKFVTQVSRPCEYLPLVPLPDGKFQVPSTITASQAREDVAMLWYLFETAYSGFEFWSREGVDFPGLFSRLEKMAEAGQPVAVQAMEQEIVKALDGLQDGHFGLAGVKRHGFYKHQDAYFADLLLEKRPSGLFVIDSGMKELKTDDQVVVSRANLFPTLSPDGKEHFLVGALSKKPRSWVTVQKAGGERIQALLHPCRLEEADFGDDTIFRLDAISGIPHVRVCSFATKAHEELLLFERSAEALKSKPEIILNLWGNSGGSSVYGTNWVKTLNGFVGDTVSVGILESPSIVESWANMNLETASPRLQDTIKWNRERLPEIRKNPALTWELHAGKPKRAGPEFPGRVIVLVNRNVASSGELTTSNCRSFPRHLIVGENTGGIGTFGEVRQYLLPHSRLFLAMPCKLFLEEGIREGRGYLPHAWLDTSTPLREVARWVQNPRDYQFSLDLPKPVAAIDFETWVNGVPQGLKRTVGVTFGPGKKFVSFVPDETNAVEGKRCALLTGNSDSRNAYFFYHQMPMQETLSVSFSVKTEALKAENGQMGNAYIGFIAKTRDSKSEWHINSLPPSSDWQRQTISLPWKREYVSVQFCFMLSISGKVWIDDIRFGS